MKDFMKMTCVLRILITFVIIFALVPDVIQAKPIHGISSRQKRVSDQRVAELETLLALSRMHGKLVTVPIAFGRMDPLIIGRRRRSSLEYDLEKLRRILQDVARDTVQQNEDNRDNDAEAQLI